MTKEATEQQPQAQSSVEITRYKDGSYGWAAKLYTGSPLPDLSALYLYDGELKKRFVAQPADNLAEELERSVAAIKREMDGGAA